VRKAWNHRIVRWQKYPFEGRQVKVENSSSKTIRWGYYICGSALGVIAIGLLLEPSEYPQLLLYSYRRLYFVLLCILFSAALFIIPKWANVSVVLTLVSAGLIISLGGLELLIRVYPLILPDVLLAEMPMEVQKRATLLEARNSQRGAQQRWLLGERRVDYIIEGYVQRLKPNITGVLRTEDKNDPYVWVVVDEVGYRNPEGLYSSSETLDIILLGDSFVRGTSRITIADFLRQFTGLKVYSLAGLGGDPQHWLIEFRAFGAVKKPWLVIVNFYEGNDISGALRLQSAMDLQIDPSLYFNSPVSELPTYEGKITGQIIKYGYKSVVFKLFWYLPSILRGKTSAEVLIGDEPYEFSLVYASPGPPSVDAPSQELQEALRIIERTLAEIKSSCLNARPSGTCIVVLSYIPTDASLYGDRFVHIENTLETTYYSESYVRQQNLSRILANIAKRNGLVYLDVSPQLREISKTEKLYGGLHFNQLGYRRYAEFVFRELLHRRILTVASAGASALLLATIP